MAEPTLEDALEAVSKLDRELKARAPNEETVARCNDFISDYEEKVAQPVMLAIKRQDALESDLAEMKEKLVEAGESETKAAERVGALELEMAQRSAVRDPSDPYAYRATPEFKALGVFCRAGDDGKTLEAMDGRITLTQEQKALLRTDINADGGYLVPSEMDSVIVKRITEIDPIRSVARVRTTASKSINLPKRDTIPIAVYEAENEEGTDSASTYDTEMVTPFRLTFTTPITLDMLQDAAFNMEAEIMSDAAEAFGFAEGQGFVTGTGVKEPEGIFVNDTLTTIESGGNPNGYRASNAASDLTLENLIDLSSDLKEGYDPVWLLNRRTLARIRKFRAGTAAVGDDGGLFMWMQQGFGDPTERTMLGFQYVLANSAPDIAADAFPIAFGDFRRAYTIIDRTGLAVIRDDLTLKKKASVEFTMHRWNTAQVTLTEPIKLLKLEA